MKKLLILSLLTTPLIGMEPSLKDAGSRQNIQKKLLQREILASLGDPQRDLIRELDFLYSLGSKTADEKVSPPKNFKSVSGIRFELAYQIYESQLIQELCKLFDVKANRIDNFVDQSICSPNKKHSIDLILDKANGYRSYTISIKNLEKKIPYDIVFRKGNNRINSISWTSDGKSVIIDEHRVVDLESLTEVLNQDNMKVSGNGKWGLYNADGIVYLAQYHDLINMMPKSSAVVKGPELSVKSSVKNYAISYDGSLILCSYKDRLIIFTNKGRNNKEELLPAVSIQCPNIIWKLGTMSSNAFYLPFIGKNAVIMADFRSKKEPVFITIGGEYYNVQQLAWSQDNNALTLVDTIGDTYEYDLTKLMKFLHWYNHKAGLGHKLLLKAIYNNRILQEKESNTQKAYRLSYPGLIALFKSIPLDLPTLLVVEGWVAIDGQSY